MFPTRQAGKARSILFCDDGNTIIIGVSTPNRLITWDIQTNTKIATIELEHPVLSMKWQKYSHIVQLIVLDGNGEQLVYRYFNQLPPNTRLGSEIRDLRGKAVQPGPFSRGSLSCCHLIIASAVETSVSIRNISLPQRMQVHPVTDFKSSSSKSIISHIHLVSTNMLLVFFQNEPRVVEYDIVNQTSVREVVLGCFPNTAAVFMASDVIMIHDTLNRGQLYSARRLEPLNVDPVLGVELRKISMPLGLVPSAGCAIFADGSTIRLIYLDNTTRHSITLPTRRIFSLDTAENDQGFCIAVAILLPTQRDSTGKPDKAWTIHVHRELTGREREQDPRDRPAPQHLPKADYINDNAPTDATPVASGSKRRGSDSILSDPSVKRLRANDLIRRSYTFQNNSCKFYGFVKQISCLTCCMPMVMDDECRFRNFRWFRNEDNGSALFAFDGNLARSEDHNTYKYHDWEPSRTPSHQLLVKVAVAKGLLPRIEAELRHVGRRDAVFRAITPGCNYTCDICHMGIFLQTWFCGSCGLELCSRCYGTLPDTQGLEHTLPCPKMHIRTWLFPVSSFSEEELKATLEEIKSVTPHPHLDRQVLCQAEISSPEVLNVRRFRSGDLEDDELDQLLDGDEPFVLTDVIKPAPPAKLLDLQGSHQHPCKVTYHDGKLWCHTDSTLENYFQTWGNHQQKARGKETRGPLQIRDYPPKHDLETLHPTLYESFASCVKHMSGTFIARRGPLNLFSYFPKGSIPPDLGPKLYISEADAHLRGSTFIHMDKSGAVNVMLHSDNSVRDGVFGARWDIWPMSDIAALCKILEPSASDDACMLGQPIISESYYACPDIISKAYNQSGVRRWVIDQKPGEAVVIPPGCPHQVSNYTNSVKIACDFVSPSKIPILGELEKMFRMMNVSEGKLIHHDLLQLDTMLWYAWKSL